MLNKYIKLRPGSSVWQIRVPVPMDVQAEWGSKEHPESLRERDPVKAQAKAIQVLARLHAEWDAIRARKRGDGPSESELLALGLSVYHQSRKAVADRRAGERFDDPVVAAIDAAGREERQRKLVRELRRDDVSRWNKATAHQLSKLGYKVDQSSPVFQQAASIVAEATIAAFDVENRVDRGELGAKPSSSIIERAEMATNGAEGKDIAFAELVKAYMVQWRAGSGSKETNTEAQKLATFRMFEGFWRNRPIRGVKAAHAAEFRDTIKLLEPTWSRSPAARKLGWDELIAKFGNRPRGLSDATMNRHMAALQSLWRWAERRGHCEGGNPFSDFHVKLRRGVNVEDYLPWETAELNRLFDPPPGRSDLCEIMLVAMFSGMRLDEIASLKWGRLRTAGQGRTAITYFDVDDAKTPAGNRQVPVHPELGWLLSRKRGGDDERIWPGFNGEGPGKKPGADAGKEFSNFKIGRGFDSRRKVFHSFRKNVVGQLEARSVPQSEVAQIVGHEKGFTFGTYGAGVSLAKKAKIIRMISYPDVKVPAVQSI